MFIKRPKFISHLPSSNFQWQSSSVGSLFWEVYQREHTNLTWFNWTPINSCHYISKRLALSGSLRALRGNIRVSLPIQPKIASSSHSGTIGDCTIAFGWYDWENKEYHDSRGAEREFFQTEASQEPPVLNDDLYCGWDLLLHVSVISMSAWGEK